MIKIQKDPSKDLVILNFSDPQLSESEWFGDMGRAEDFRSRKILENTVSELVRRVSPDLITVSGDLAWAGQRESYHLFGNVMDKTNIPWTFVLGNHDNERGDEESDRIAEQYMKSPSCLFEKGDRALGCGNFTLAICEGERIVHAIIMMDSHDRMPYTDKNRNVTSEWARLTTEQIKWYENEITFLRSIGCEKTTLMLHIPIYTYRKAFAAAFDPSFDRLKITTEESNRGIGWRDGYKTSFGVCYDEISSYPEDDGVFDAILRHGSTKTVLCGHDHVNSTVISYKGVTLAFSLKLGNGCYWDPDLNGGTVLSVDGDGNVKLHHEYVKA